MPFSQNSDFMLSAKNIKQFPNDSGIEIAFVGRSNSGKSSAINAILNSQKVSINQYPSIGCNIKWHPGEEPVWFGGFADN